MKEKLIYVTFRNIAALDTGDKIVSYSFLKQLSSKYDIHLINILDEGDYNEQEIEKLNSPGITYTFLHEKDQVSIFTMAKSFINSVPLVFTRKTQRTNIQKEINRIANEVNPDKIIWDHLRSIAYFSEQLLKFHNILIEHNNESNLLIQRSKNSFFPTNFALLWQAFLIDNTLKKIYSKFTKIIFISSYDTGTLKNKPCKYSLLKKLNLYFNHSLYKVQKKEKLNLIFIGSLDWFPNIEGIKWFIKEVIPLITVNFKLTIVGRNPDKDIIELSGNGIDIFANVSSIEEYIQKADVFICPIFSGGGINIKILEALSYGIPIVGTKHSYRGYENLEFLSSYNDPIDFANQINQLGTNFELRKSVSESELSYYKMYNELSEFELLNAIQ